MDRKNVYICCVLCNRSTKNGVFWFSDWYVHLFHTHTAYKTNLRYIFLMNIDTDSFSKYHSSTLSIYMYILLWLILVIQARTQQPTTDNWVDK